MKDSVNKPMLVLQLKNQLSAIENYCNQYDAGDVTVIKSIAAMITAIFHNTDGEKSLISQLKLSHIQLYCSAETYNPKNPVNFIGLLKLVHKPKNGWDYFAKLDHSALVNVPLENWWNNKKVIVDSSLIAYSRAKIVKSFAGLEQITLDTSGWRIKDANGNLATINPLAETIRQVAFELLQRFKEIDISKESKLHHKD